MRTVLELETIAAQGWRGTTVAGLGDWLLRAGHGFTGRANSVLPSGSAGVGLDTALELVADFYAAQSLPAVFQVPQDQPGSQLAALDVELRRRGWSPYNTAAFLTAPIDSVVQVCPRSPALPPAIFESTPGPAWLEGYHYRGRPLPSSAIAVLTNADSPTFVSVSDPAGLAGVARGVVTTGWLGVTAVTVAAERRRSGVGRHLMGELARWAAGRGARSIYLQVDAANPVALAMYERLGFSAHHHYHYLAAPVR